MKKVLISVAFVGAMAMAACTSGSEKADDTQATATEVVDQINATTSEAEATDIVTKAQAYVDELVKSGKVQEAKEYLDKIAPAIKEKYPNLAPTLDKIDAVISAAVGQAVEVNEAVKAAPDSLAKTVEEVKAAGQEVVDKANEAVEQGKEAVEQGKEAVKDAADKLKALGK